MAATDTQRDGDALDAGAWQVTVTFGDFAREALTAEAERQGVTVEQLVVHGAMHYLADLDARRSRRAIGPLRSTA